MPAVSLYHVTKSALTKNVYHLLSEAQAPVAMKDIFAALKKKKQLVNSSRYATFQKFIYTHISRHKESALFIRISKGMVRLNPHAVPVAVNENRLLVSRTAMERNEKATLHDKAEIKIIFSITDQLPQPFRKKIKEVYRCAALLYYGERKTKREIAEQLSLNEEQVKQLLIKFQKKIRFLFGYYFKRVEAIETENAALKLKNAMQEISISELSDKIKTFDPAVKSAEPEIDPVLAKPVSELAIPARVHKYLKSKNIKYVNDLLKIPVSEMMRGRNMGTRSINYLKHEISRLGLALKD